MGINFSYIVFNFENVLVSNDVLLEFKGVIREMMCLFSWEWICRVKLWCVILVGWLFFEFGCGCWILDDIEFDGSENCFIVFIEISLVVFISYLFVGSWNFIVRYKNLFVNFSFWMIWFRVLWWIVRSRFVIIKFEKWMIFKR